MATGKVEKSFDLGRTLRGMGVEKLFNDADLRAFPAGYEASRVFEDSTARIHNLKLLKQLHCQQHFIVSNVLRVFRVGLPIREKKYQRPQTSN